MKKKPIEQKTQPGTINKRSLIAAMRRLSTNEDFRILRGRWLDLRMGILEEGKKKPAESQWSVLSGFDKAILEAERWAEAAIEEDEAGRRAEQLQEQLA